MLTDAQARLIELDRRKEEIDAYYEELEATLKELHQESGVDSYFQNPNTGVVYKVVKPKGTFVSFRDLGYVRTKKPNEEKGSLSVKEAQAKGFKVSQ